ncbi:MAG TPA: hypothetical protein DER10_03645 [Elusimicrobia bacterium]|nr:hypothetical protein [Elusimicrobiota bacterium]HCE97572.1 hypothetical protein [Elusimicrobiota bacterium]
MREGKAALGTISAKNPMNIIFKSIRLGRRIAAKIGMPQLNRGRTYAGAEYSGEAASELIKNTLLQKEPCMIARFGAADVFAAVNYIDRNNYKKVSDILKYVLGKKVFLYWSSQGAGYFPEDIGKVEDYMRLLFNDMRFVDILGSWWREEMFLQKELSQAVKVRLPDLEPYYHTNPWSIVLKNKRVLVIHPFEESIKSQYAKRKLLFKDNNILPDFKLLTIKADYSLAETKTICTDWINVYEPIKEKIDQTDFDIAIIGCGSCGFNLAAHIKRIGKKAVVLGGATQILFGIKGKRWADHPVISKLFNEHWVYPQPSEVPINYKQADQGCFWQ